MVRSGIPGRLRTDRTSRDDRCLCRCEGRVDRSNLIGYIVALPSIDAIKMRISAWTVSDFSLIINRGVATRATPPAAHSPVSPTVAPLNFIPKWRSCDKVVLLVV